MAICLLAAAGCFAAEPASDARPPGWSVLGKDHVCAVAWSPKGEYIAFVAAHDIAPDVCGRVIPYGDVWVMKVSPSGAAPQLRRLARRKPGIPLGLFWLSGGEIGWAESASYPTGFTLCAARVSDGKVRQLTERRFQPGYVDHAGEEPLYGPADICYDAPTRSVFFLGWDEDTPSHRFQVGRYNLGDRTFTLKTLGEFDFPSFCCASDDHAEPRLYVAGVTDLYGRHKGCIRCYDWPDTTNGEIIVESDHIHFPRTSPDGRMIAWVEWRDDRSEIVVCDLTTKKRRLVATYVEWCDENSKGEISGCPYSWSPTSREIAYTDEKMVHVVAVETKGSSKCLDQPTPK